MSSIKAHLGIILLETKELSEEHMTEQDEFVAVNKIELAVHEARKVFERTKKINNEESSTLPKTETKSP